MSGNARLFFRMPHDMANLFRIGVLTDEDVYDANGVIRGHLSIDGITLLSDGKTYSFYEAAIENSSQLGNGIKVQSGWKYWFVKRKGQLVSFSDIRLGIQKAVNDDISNAMKALGI